MRKLISFISLGVVLSPGLVFASDAYQLVFKQPASIQLKLISDDTDSTGYTRRYQVISNAPQDRSDINLLTITHGNTVKFSPKEAMQEVVQGHEMASCAQKNAHLILLTPDSVIFSTYLGQCSNGKTLSQIHHSFSTPDGQYAINYSADPSEVSKQTQQSMQNLVKSAKLVSNQGPSKK